MTFTVPAVVVGGGINGLGVARSLASARVPVWLLDKDPDQPGMHTRNATPVRLPTLAGPELVEALVAISEREFKRCKPVLILTQEHTVKIVSQFREDLWPHYRFLLPPHDVLGALLHKSSFQALAEKNGFSVPKSVHVRAREDLKRVRGMQLPVVIKPGTHGTAYDRHFKKAYRADSEAQTERLLGAMLDMASDVMVQEWIEGPDSNIFFCLQYISVTGTLQASFTGRKLRSWPPRVGGTASCTSATAEHGELSRITTEFFQLAGVCGFAGMEYKRDETTGRWVMVEPTVGRTDYQEEVATLNGVNVPFAAYCSLLGRGVTAPFAPRRPVVWRERESDTQSAAAQGQRLVTGMPPGAVVKDALWRWSDPRPFLAARVWRRLRMARRPPRESTNQQWMAGK